MRHKKKWSGGVPKTPKLSDYSLDDMYSEEAVWLCENLETHYKTRIQGALAQILQKYPQEYSLKLLYVKEFSDEHRSAAG